MAYLSGCATADCRRRARALLYAAGCLAISPQNAHGVMSGSHRWSARPWGSPPPRAVWWGGNPEACAQIKRTSRLGPRGLGERAFVAPAQDRRVEFAAVDEDRGREIEEHERDHGGREAGVGRHVAIGVLRQIRAEAGAAGEPQGDGDDD